jgi:hypothetical protein
MQTKKALSDYASQENATTGEDADIADLWFEDREDGLVAAQIRHRNIFSF